MDLSTSQKNCPVFINIILDNFIHKCFTAFDSDILNLTMEDGKTLFPLTSLGLFSKCFSKTSLKKTLHDILSLTTHKTDAQEASYVWVSSCINLPK